MLDHITTIGEGDDEVSVMARVTAYSLGSPHRLNVHPELSEEGEYAWAEFDLLTDDGQEADWPFMRATEHDLRRIEIELIDKLERDNG